MKAPEARNRLFESFKKNPAAVFYLLPGSMRGNYTSSGVSPIDFSPLLGIKFTTFFPLHRLGKALCLPHNVQNPDRVLMNPSIMPSLSIL